MRAGTAHVELSTALDEATKRYGAANPESKRRHTAATEWLPGANTRTSLHYSPFPLTFAKGEAQWLFDVDGHTYRDFLGDYSAGLYGHSHPAILDASRAALDVGIALGGPNEYEAELAQLICARFPSVERLRFTNSGTEANLLAMAAARAVTGKDGIFVFEGGYHGSLLTFRGSRTMNAPYDFLIGRYNDVERTVAAIEAHRHRLAAVVLEPMLGGGGVIPATQAFLEALREITARTGVLLIFDEVMTSRLGPGGLQGLAGIQPDLTTFGKYLGGGFSFGAFGGRSDVMDRFDPARPDALSHAGTFNNDVVTMAAGIAGLRNVFTPEVALAHNARGDDLRNRLNHVFAAAGVAMTATGVGSILGVHFQTTPITTASDVVAADAKGALLHLEMIARGFYSARRGYLALSLPLTAEDLDDFVAAMRDIIDQHRSVLEEEPS